MVQKLNFSWLALVFSVLFFVGCVGDEDEELASFLEVTDQRLASLEIIEGGVLYYNGEVLEEFDPDNVGPYSVELSDQSITSITLRATLVDSTSSLILVERDKDKEDEDDTDPEDRLTDIVAGESFTAQIDEGQNIIFIRVKNEETGASTNYFIEVDRVSTSADLAGLAVLSFVDSTTEVLTLDPEFDEDVTAYTATVDARSCEVQLLTFLESSTATLDIVGGNYIEVNASGQRYVGISEGDNVIDVNLVSEDGSESKTYTITLTREEPSDDLRESDPRLKSFAFADGRPSTAFRCTGNIITRLVTNSVTTTGITVETEYEGVTIELGNASLDEDSGLPFVDSETALWAFENEVTLTSGVEYNGGLLDDLVEGNNYFVVNTTSADEDTFSTFRINIFRSENNEVFVSNAEELQAALKNAMPNDAIIVEAGDYHGLTGLEFSGSDNAHFFSDVDGTEDDPIFLIANVNASVTLFGDDLTQNDVMRIEGDHWRLTGFEMSGAQNGLVLDGANQSLFSNLVVEDVGERGLIVANGSNNNEFSFISIDDTGLVPQARDGIDEVYGEAIVIGGGELASENNILTNLTLGKDVLQAIDVKADATNTTIKYSNVTFDNTLSQPISDRAIISIASDNNEISFNQFEYEDISFGTDDIASIINFDTPEGSSSDVYQNGFALEEDPSIVALRNSNAGTVVTSGNLNSDASAVLVEGSFSNDFVDPIYQIRSNLDETQCLAIRDVLFGDNTEATTVVAADDCADEPEQRWQFVHDVDGYVFIAQASNLGNKIFGVDGQVDGDFDLTAMREDSGSVFDDAFGLRWRVLVSEGEVVFSSKESASDFIIETEGYVFNDDEEETYDFTPVRVGDTSEASSRTFTLIQLN